MSKRPGSPLSGPPAKKRLPTIATINVGSVAGQEDLDIKTLLVQNKMLAETVRQRNSQENTLRARVSVLEKEQQKSEVAVAAVMSYWNRFDEQLQAMLVQCGAVRTLGKQPDCASPPVRALIKDLSSVSEESPAHAELRDRCQFTVSSTRELTVTLDRLYQRFSDECADVELGKENERLHELVNALRGQVCESGRARDEAGRLQQRTDTLATQVEAKQHDLDKAHNRMEKLRIRLEDAQQLQRQHQQSSGGSSDEQAAAAATPAGGGGAGQQQSDPQATAASGGGNGNGGAAGNAPPVDSAVYDELKQHQELSTSRLKEVDELQERLQVAIRDLELTKAAAHQVSDVAIQHSPLFLSLQSQYSTLFQERQQLKALLDEAVEQLKECKEQYTGHLDKVEADEMKYHRAAQEDIGRLSERLADSQRGLHAARMESEQNRVASEQASTLKELRRFAGGLQKENKQLKAELTRCKHTAEESATMLERLRDGAPLAALEVRAIEKRVTDKPKEQEQGGDVEALRDELKKTKELLKKAQEAEQESKMLLDAYKGVSKEVREKVDVMASEAKQKIELEEMRQTLEAQRERLVRDCLNDSEASLRWKEAQDTIHQLHEALSASRRNHEALLSEMDVTGEAFEDMQEQNARLLSQLQEKDDANFKLMSERINANSLHGLLREEKHALETHTQVLQLQLATQSELIQRLHEKERLLHLDLAGREEEIARRLAQAESLKRKALECAQSAQDRKIQAEKSSGEAKDLRQRLADQQARVEQEQHAARRLREEMAAMQQRVDRGKLSSSLASSAATTDEILQEEVRIYKTRLTCPCCNTNKKDCILMKCYHVFCFDCVQKRYDTRQRKCPKCNAAFGQNDFHRVYL